jgi:hypothetical protein
VKREKQPLVRSMPETRHADDSGRWSFNAVVEKYDMKKVPVTSCDVAIMAIMTAT